MKRIFNSHAKDIKAQLTGAEVNEKAFMEQEQRVREGRATGSLREALGNYTEHSDYYLRYSPLLRFSTEAIDGITEYSNQVSIRGGRQNIRFAINENGNPCEILHFRFGDEAFLEVRGNPGVAIQTGDRFAYDSENHCLRKMSIEHLNPDSLIVGNAVHYCIIGSDGYSIVRVRLSNDVFVYNPLSQFELTHSIPNIDPVPLPELTELTNIYSMEIQMAQPSLSLAYNPRYATSQLRLPQDPNRVILRCRNEQPIINNWNEKVIVGMIVQNHHPRIWVGNRADFEHPAGIIMNISTRFDTTRSNYEENLEIELSRETQIEHNGDNGGTLIYHPEINPRIKEAMFGSQSHLQRVVAYAHSPAGLRNTHAIASEIFQGRHSAWMAEYMQEPHLPFNPLMEDTALTIETQRLETQRIRQRNDRIEKTLKALEGYYEHRCMGCDQRIQIKYAREHMRDDGKIGLEPFIDLWRKGVVQFFCCSCFSKEKRMTDELKERQKQVLSTIETFKKHSDGSLDQDVDFILSEFYKTCTKEVWEILKLEGDEKRLIRLKKEAEKKIEIINTDNPNQDLVRPGDVVAVSENGSVIRANIETPNHQIIGVVGFDPAHCNAPETAYQPGDNVPIIRIGSSMTPEVITSLREAVNTAERREFHALTNEIITDICEGTGIPREQLVGNDENIRVNAENDLDDNNYYDDQEEESDDC